MQRFQRFLGEWLRLMTVGDSWLNRGVRLSYALATVVSGPSLRGIDVWVRPEWNNAPWEWSLGWLIVIAGGAAYVLFVGGEVWVDSRLSALRVTRVDVNVAPAYFVNLTVQNPSGRPVPGCYGKVVRFEKPPNSDDEALSAAFRFPWSTHGGGSRFNTRFQD